MRSNRVPTAFQPRSNRVPTAFQPRSNRVPTAFQPRSNRVPTAFQPRSNRVPTAFNTELHRSYRCHTHPQADASPTPPPPRCRRVPGAMPAEHQSRRVGCGRAGDAAAAHFDRGYLPEHLLQRAVSPGEQRGAAVGRAGADVFHGVGAAGCDGPAAHLLRGDRPGGARDCRLRGEAAVPEGDLRGLLPGLQSGGGGPAGGGVHAQRGGGLHHTGGRTGCCRSTSGRRWRTTT